MTDATTSPYLEAQARRKDMEERLAGLEKAVAAATAAPGWASNVHDRLVSLHQALAHHVMAVEAADGLLGEIVEAAPRLSNAVERMKDDHVRLADQITTLIDTAEEQGPLTLREHVVELMREMVLHRQRGSDLVYEAYSRDIGGLDS